MSRTGAEGASRSGRNGGARMSGGAANGYEVQKDGMSGEAGKLDRAGDDVGDIRKAVDMEVCYTTDALGGSDSGPAYNTFAAAWQAEAKVLETALHQLADKVRLSEHNYQGADGFARNVLHSAAGGDGLTTMPAPAGPLGVTTMPAPATLPNPGITGGPVPGERPAAVGEPPITGGPAPATHTPPGLPDFG